VPLLFVRGNHDPPRPLGDYPIGGDLDERVTEILGLRIAGLEGAHWYRGGPQQYHDWQMRLKVLRLSARLRRRPLDILLLHGPPAGVHEGTDLAHQGLASVRRATERWQPRLVLHGHVHPHGSLAQRDTTIGPTRVVNVHGHRLLELDTIPRES
jgi:Icc-related predicted phosphoesterase